jgi:hypothetical protein
MLSSFAAYTLGLLLYSSPLHITSSISTERQPSKRFEAFHQMGLLQVTYHLIPRLEHFSMPWKTTQPMSIFIHWGIGGHEIIQSRLVHQEMETA